jgi:hypothetical protein
MPLIATAISFLALVISGITAWLTLLRKGQLRMTRPAVIFFGPDGPPSQGAEVKIYLRTMLYSTAKRAQLVESMHVRLHRGESVQTFNIWVYGEKGRLVRGSGLRVADDGVTWDHHFILPKDGTPFLFLPGPCRLDVFATLVGSQHSQMLSSTNLTLSDQHAVAIRSGSGVFFDWGPESGAYHAHVDNRPREFKDQQQP